MSDRKKPTERPLTGNHPVGSTMNPNEEDSTMQSSRKPSIFQPVIHLSPWPWRKVYPMFYAAWWWHIGPLTVAGV